MTRNDSPEPRPLDYQSAKPKAPVGSAVAGVFFGFLSTVGGVLLGFSVAERAGIPIYIGGPLIVAIFFAVLLWARSAFSGSLPIEEHLRRRRFYIIGFLIGCGIGGLLEGLCFAALKNI